MKVSLNVVKRFVDVDLGVDELVQKINQQLGGVEEVVDLAPKYKDVVIVKVVACEKHPDADRLSVCLVDDGGAVGGVERDGDGYVQVVCGAPNVRAGIFAAWLPPKSTVPASYDEAEPFVLSAREIRGVKSNGMLAAADELALGSDHEGIIEITEGDLPPFRPASLVSASAGQTREDPKQTRDEGLLKPGMSFAEVFGLDDVIIDIENKMFTHRPDLFGQLGVAREIAGITGKRFVSPEWYTTRHPELISGSPGQPTEILKQVQHDRELALTVFNEASEKCPRFMAVAIKDITVAPSPLWLQVELVRLGGKPINNIVDATNYAMLLTAQPTHAYDYDKLRGATLGVRMARPNETIKLLNDKTYSLDTDDVVIVDGEGIVGLGGVMGGGNSEVSDDTKNVVLECADFDMYAVRKTSMRHGLFTDAVTRFSKGQSPLQQPVVLSLLMQSVFDTAGGEQASEVFDAVHNSDDDCIDMDCIHRPNALEVTARFIGDRLGVELDSDTIKTLLENVEFKVVIDDQGMDIFDPFWRTDIELPEDIVEEVGRLYGFDKLPRELPRRSISPAPENPLFMMKQRVRSALRAAGANEVLTYSFVHERLLTGATQDSAQAFRLGNALSPDLQYYRLSVLPSLLAHVHANIKAGHDEFALFEFGKAHRKGDMDDEGLPREYPRLAFVYAAKKSDQTAYYMARRYAEAIAPGLRYEPLTSFDAAPYPIFEQLAAPFEPKRSAVLMSGDRFVGVAGEFKASVRRAFKLPEASAGFEMFQSYLTKASQKPYIPLSRFPGVTQDITLRVAADMPLQQLTDVVAAALENAKSAEMTAHIDVTGIYQPEASEVKNVTYRLMVASYEKTLTDNEVNALTDVLAGSAAEAVGAVRI